MNELLRKDDYWAIWIGSALLLLGLTIFFTNPPSDLSKHEELEDKMATESAKAPFKTVEWYEANDQLMSVKGSSTPTGKFLGKFLGKPGSWTTNPIDAFITTEQQVIAKKERLNEKLAKATEAEAFAKKQAQAQQALADSHSFEQEGMNKEAMTAIDEWRSALANLKSVKKKAGIKAGQKFSYLLLLLLGFSIIFGFAKWFAGISPRQFLPGFALVFGLGILAYLLAGQADLKAMGLGYALWAIVLGLLISNTIGIPEWVKPALSTEFYIKTGLVLLGAEILMGKVLAIGLPGIFVAWVVTPIVLISTYWFGQKILKIPSKTLNITVSADMSVCGVSAAVATAAASKASKEELTLAIGLSMVFTSIMMVVMPLFINWVGMPEILGGAWMGGTIDATGAVVAAGAFLGEKALSVAATIKMIQNILIGLVAFGVAIYFTSGESKAQGNKIGFGEVWKRFPKFILGFIGASIIFSILYEAVGNGTAYSLIEQGVIGGYSKNIRGWLFCLAFVSIGLSTNFKMLQSHLKGGKPLLLYILGQTFNLLLTLGMAYLMFYVVFDSVLEKI